MKEIHLYLSGLVQGVGFRFFVKRIAKSLNITGFVRNLYDGRVEVLAEAEDFNLKQLIEKIRIGNGSIRVTDMKSSAKEIKQNRFPDFTIEF